MTLLLLPQRREPQACLYHLNINLREKEITVASTPEITTKIKLREKNNNKRRFLAVNKIFQSAEIFQAGE